MCVSHTSGTSLGPLFISGKLGTSEPIEETKFDFEEAIFNYILKWESASCLASFVSLDAFSKLQWNDSAVLCYTIIISVQKLTQVIKSVTKGFPRIHKHNKTTAINWDKGRICSEYWSKRISRLIVRSAKCHCSLFPYFWDGDKKSCYLR